MSTNLLPTSLQPLTRKQFYTIFIISSCVCLLMLGSIHLYFSGKLSDLKTKLNNVNQITLKQQQLNRLINQQQLNNKQALTLLIDISKIIPKQIQLTTIYYQNKRLTLIGSAKQSNSITQFIFRLNRLKHYRTNVEKIQSQQHQPHFQLDITHES